MAAAEGLQRGDVVVLEAEVEENWGVEGGQAVEGGDLVVGCVRGRLHKSRRVKLAKLMCRMG